MLKAIEGVAVVILQFLGMEGAKLALGDILAVLVVSGVAWALLSAIVGNIIVRVFSKRFDERRLDDAMKYGVVLLGVSTFFAGFYLYSIGF